MNPATNMATDKQLAEVLPMAPIDPIPSGSSKINVGPSERWLSLGGGAILTAIGLRRGGVGGAFLAAIGGVLAFRGATGYCPVNEAIGRDTSEEKTETQLMEISKSVTVDKPRSEVYQFWRQLENLPYFMNHLESVTQQDSKRSHWVARLDSDNSTVKSLSKLEWDAEITEEELNNRLVWRSVPGATVDNAGEVRFVDAANGQGTDVYVTIKYRAPQGMVGETLARFFNPLLKHMVKKDILRFKEVLETRDSIANLPKERINPSLV